MDSPPPSTPPYTRSSAEPRLRSKPASRLAPALDGGEGHNDTQIVPFLATPPSRKKSPLSASPLHLSSHSPVPLKDLLLLSPSPRHKPKGRLAVEESLEVAAAGGTPRRKGKSRAAAVAAMGLMGCASPRNARRARRRLEKEIVREEREIGPAEDDGGRVRRRRQSRSKVANKERLSLLPSVPSSPGPAAVGGSDGRSSVDGLQEHIIELVMWKNVAKSTLWFGLGSMFFLSSCFSKDFSFRHDIISAMSHLGVIILGVAFFKDSVPHRHQLKTTRKLQLTEADVVRAAQVILPVANAALAKTQEIFCGDPLRTLQACFRLVAPVLLFGAMYGHLITLRRLLATGFFLSFTLPKLYSCYSQQIHNKVESTISRVQEAWRSCPRKKLIAASAATMFWNLFGVKSRIFAAFISLVILRYHHQQVEDNGKRERKEEEQQEAELQPEQDDQL
uniref:Reticulon domain-containing protein n=1 Tax=Musa acuminata subsp. malaccensis TaxID=214687 RepID=A0A804I7V9_MUSAM